MGKVHNTTLNCACIRVIWKRPKRKEALVIGSESLLSNDGDKGLIGGGLTAGTATENENVSIKRPCV